MPSSSSHPLARPLTAAEAEASRAAFGRNVLTVKRKKSFFRRFLSNLSDPVIRILLAKGHRVEQLKSEALRIVLGVLLLVFGSTILAVGEDIVKLLLAIIGWIIIALTTVLGVIEILHIALEKPNYKTGEPIYVEHTEE